ELEERNVVILVDVVHSGGLVDRLTRICDEAQPKQLLRMAVIDQNSSSERYEPIHALWRERRENRVSLADYLRSEKNIEALRFYDPEFARGSAKQDLPKEIANRSAARETIEREIDQIRPLIHRTNALQADRSIGGVHYAWVIDLLRLLEDSD